MVKSSRDIAWFFVALLPLLGACTAQQKKLPAASPAPTVSVSAAHVTVILPHETLAGIVAPYANVAIQSTLTEPAINVAVVEGQHVAQGQLLAQLDTSDLVAALNADIAAAESDRANTTHTIYQGSLSIDQGDSALRSAQTAVKQAKNSLARDAADLNRYQNLLASGFVSAQQVATQRSTVLNDEQAVVAAQASLASAQSQVTANGQLTSNGLQATSVAQAKAEEHVALAQAQEERVQIAKARILSSVDGIVVNRNLNPGEYPGTRQIFTIQQIDPIYIVLHASAGQVEGVEAGGTAEVHVANADHPILPARIVGVLNAINPGSTDFQIKAQLPNPFERLRPGMPIEAQLTLQPVHGVAVPLSAFTDDVRSHVLIVEVNHTVKDVAVRYVADDGHEAIVRGLEPGVQVIANGQSPVTPGAHVDIK